MWYTRGRFAPSLIGLLGTFALWLLFVINLRYRKLNSYTAEFENSSLANPAVLWVPVFGAEHVALALKRKLCGMKYTKQQVKYIIAIYSVGMSLMSMLVPVPIIAQIAQAFPNENIAMVQMCIGIIPLCMAVSALLISTFLVQRVHKRTIVLVCHILLMLAGLSVLALHDSLKQVLAVSAVIGLGIGGMQNGTDAIIADYFEGSRRGSIMGIFSTFVALGGILWTVLSGILGSGAWYMSYAVYALNIPFIIVEFILMPQGHLEPKRKSNVFANIPKEVAIITVANFIFVLCFQVFQTNSSLIVATRGLGGAAESGIVSSVTSFAGVFAGLLVGPSFKRFKNLSMPMFWCVTAVGLVCAAVAPSLLVLALGGFICSLGKESFLPLEGNFAAGNSSNEGRAFNLAIGMAGANVGMALSPLVFEGLSAPLGCTIESKFAIAIAIVIALIVFGFIKYRKLTPAQLGEARAETEH